MTDIEKNQNKAVQDTRETDIQSLSKDDQRGVKEEKLENVDQLLDPENNNKNNSGDYSKQDYSTQNGMNIQQYYSMRKDRKQAEKNAELLANRIALLKQEEIRTLKKIEETRKKALEIYYLKLKNESKQKKKKDKEKEQQTSHKKAATETKTKNIQNMMQNLTQQSNQPLRKQKEELREEPVKITKEELAELKKKNHDKMKKLSSQNEMIIKQRNESLLHNNKQKNAQSKNRQVEAKDKIRNYYINKKEVILHEINDKMQREEIEKNVKNKEIKQMEDFEVELIARLQSTQDMQKHAYDELESALMLSANDFADKFLKQDHAEDHKSEDEVKSRSRSNSQKSKKGEEDEFDKNQEVPTVTKNETQQA